MLGKITGNKMILGAVVGILGGLVVAVVLVMVLGVGRGSPEAEAARSGDKPAAAKTAEAAKTPSKGQPQGGTEAKFGPTYVIRDRIVNLADAGGRRYLRFTVAIEFAPPDDKKGSVSTSQLALYEPEVDASVYQQVAEGKNDPDKEFQAKIKKFGPALEDAVTTVLSSKTSADLSSAEGKEQAKREIKDRCQRIVGDEQHVTNVYFTDFVMQ